MIGVGDEVVCIFPGKGTGKDCQVGQRFIVRAIVKAVESPGTALVFDCHPYMDGMCIHPGARAWRFAKVDDIKHIEAKHKELVFER